MIAFIVFLFVYVFYEIVIFYNYGHSVIHDKNSHMIEEVLPESKLNTLDIRILMCDISRTELKVWYIAKLSSIIFSHYVNSAEGDYLIYRYSKNNQLIKSRYDSLLTYHVGKRKL